MRPGAPLVHDSGIPPPALPPVESAPANAGPTQSGSRPPRPESSHREASGLATLAAYPLPSSLRSSSAAQPSPTHPEIQAPPRPSARLGSSNKQSRPSADYRPPAAAAQKNQASAGDRL